MRWFRDRWGRIRPLLSKEEARQGDDHLENSVALHVGMALVCVVFAVLFTAVWLSR